MEKTQTGISKRWHFSGGLWDAQASRANLLRSPEKTDIFSIAHLSKIPGSTENVIIEDQLCSVWAIGDIMREVLFFFQFYR